MPPGLRFHRRGWAVGRKLYVGNLAYGLGSADLGTAFGAHGAVRSARVIVDPGTGRSRGFGFVVMGSEPEARAAVAALDGAELGGRRLVVREAGPNVPGGRRAVP